MIDSTFSKSHRTSASMAYDRQPQQIGKSRGELSTKIHVLCGEKRVPIDFCITNGEVDVKAGYELVRANRHLIENMFSVLKDWRGIAMRYCRNAHAFLSFVAIALLCSFV